jgi:GNAT superfamily N-acetyltransferase
MQFADISIRTTLQPGDIGMIVHLHGVLYAQEYGFDATFESYVAGPLADFVQSATARQRLWIAENENRIVGCIAIVSAEPQTAQLRWFLVHPSARGIGLGNKLLNEAVTFSRQAGYESIFLWTVDALAAARHLYLGAGFRKVEARPGFRWGVHVVEEKYELSF